MREESMLYDSSILQSKFPEDSTGKRCQITTHKTRSSECGYKGTVRYGMLGPYHTGVRPLFAWELAE